MDYIFIINKNAIITESQRYVHILRKKHAKEIYIIQLS